jgi:hypothetical protein
MFEAEKKRLNEIKAEMDELQRQRNMVNGPSVSDRNERLRLAGLHWELDKEAYRLNLDMRIDELNTKIMKVMNSKDDDWGDVCQCHRGTNHVYKEIKS